MVPQLFQIKNRNHGFTLMELLVVIGILGLLAIAGLTSYTSSIKSSRDAKRKTDLETIRQAMELYHSDNSGTVNPYPNAAGGSVGDLSCSGGCNGTNGLQCCLTPTYLSTASFPQEPLSSRNYFFERNSLDPNQYRICAYLENFKTGVDPACPSGAGYGAPSYCGTGSVVCNYGLTQP